MPLPIEWALSFALAVPICSTVKPFEWLNSTRQMINGTGSKCKFAKAVPSDGLLQKVHMVGLSSPTQLNLNKAALKLIALNWPGSAEVC